MPHRHRTLVAFCCRHRLADTSEADSALRHPGKRRRRIEFERRLLGDGGAHLIAAILVWPLGASLGSHSRKALGTAALLPQISALRSLPRVLRAMGETGRTGALIVR